jgi:Fe-S cluster assembly protein SufD
VPSFAPLLAREPASVPAWLTERRRAAAERFSAASLPSPDEEIWRYSRISELDLDAFAALGGSTSWTGPAGYVSAAAASDDGVVGRTMATATDVFAELNDALSEPVVVRIPAGKVVDEPIVVVHHLDADGAAFFPRLVIEAGADCEVTVVERFTSTDVHALVCPVLELRAHPAARVKYLGVNEVGTRVWFIASQVAEGDRDSTTMVSSVSLGGDYARIHTIARLVGQGASGEQVALYFGEGRQMHDVRTLQDHVAPKTTSNLLFKGALEGHSNSVYTGLIRVRKEARGTVAFQTNRNLKLSEGTWAESVPNLDIETNDVKCSHASAVGPIDEEQRFYLESRGVPTAVAERLVVLGFFEEVISRLPHQAVAEELRVAVAAKLDRRDA